MSITTASIPLGATYAPSGGTATSFIVKKATDAGMSVVLDDGSDFLSQTEMSFTTKEPKSNDSAPNGYTQGRNNVHIKVPLSLDNGNRTVNNVKIEISSDIETTDAERATLRELAAHVLLDADYQDFWDAQARS